MTLTHTQVFTANDIIDNPWLPCIQPPERHGRVLDVRDRIMDELYPAARSPQIIEGVCVHVDYGGCWVR